MKKQLAVLIAATTAVSMGTPAFADVIESNDSAAVEDLKEKVAEAMRLDYTDDINMLVQDDSGVEFSGSDSLSAKTYTPDELDGENVYLVQITVPDGDDTKTINCETFSEFERKFDDAYMDLDQGEKINLVMTSKSGYRELPDGSITNASEAKVYEDEDGALKIEDGDSLPSSEQTAELVGEYDVELDTDGTYLYKIKLSDYDGNTDRFIDSDEIKAGLTAFDVTKPILKTEDAGSDSWYLDEDGNPILKVEEDDEIKLENGIVSILDEDGDERLPEDNDGGYIQPVVDGFLPMYDGVESSSVIRDAVQKDVETFEVKAQDFYDVDTGRLTEGANDLLAKLDLEHDFIGLYDDSDDTLAYEDGNQNLVAKVKVIRSSGDKDGKAYRAVVTEENLQNMGLLLSQNEENKNYVVQAAGEDRYASAVQVARAMESEMADDNGFIKREEENGDYDEINVKTVVLVSGENKSIVDGLTAAPYAHVLQEQTDDNGELVPVLLTKNDELPEVVVDYLKDKNVEKVKIVGGVVSESVVNELENDLVITDVERIEGDTRYDTAMEVADEIKDLNKDADGDDDYKRDAYIVNGDALADSLSIAGVAANDNAPILLTMKNKIPSDVVSFVEDDSKEKAYIIGGLNSISNDVVRTLLSDVDDVSINRVHGENRQETNAEVMEEFFIDGDIPIENIAIARGDGNSIVDALSAGVYAGKDAHTALVLTGEEGLVSSQKDNISEDDLNKLLQVGYAVPSEDAEYLFDKLPSDQAADGYDDN